MVSQPLGRPATYSDILALPDNVVGEIVGDLVVSPRPKVADQNVASEMYLGFEQDPPAAGPAVAELKRRNEGPTQAAGCKGMRGRQGETVPAARTGRGSCLSMPAHRSRPFG